jgi:Ca-activated chloride channel family protein
MALAACATKLDGQDHPLPSEPAITAIDRSWPDVNLNVLVLDKSGAPQKIGEQTFQLFEDHAERPLRFPAAEDSPVSLALLIDNSASAQERKPAIVSAVKAIIQALPADSEVTAISFGSVAFLEFPFTPASKVDLSLMDKIPAEGLTALYDAVAMTEDYFVANAKYQRRALVVLSDGEDNASRNTAETVLRGVLFPGAPTIYACRVRDPRRTLNELKESARGTKILKFLAEVGGGPVFDLDPDPTAAAAQIVAAIRSQHVLQFTAADPARDGKERKLAVRLPVKDVQIHVSPAYFAPAK